MQYYDDHAFEYSQMTLPINLEEQYAKFLRTIPANGFILDAGCGSGRDAHYFLEKGYNVDAFDASANLARLAGKLTGLNIRHLRFQDFTPRPIYDGIWGNASLLHVPNAELHDVLVSLKQSLKPGGTFYCSFKYGKQNSTDDAGRKFTNKTCEALDSDLANAGFTARRSITLQHSITPDGIPQDWVAGIAIAP
ncbi:class I SAM-dependent methyltransferase [Halodesulfovibrio sp.]|jgi:SAM-dependent methyltransferase|uniref:class I SAM-dependent methyltransferase n=1 Tax=Halodesulfovibrio sp. TaxID=1912772 RepID=UPI0025D569F2|nr:class I SAM-dependent methyltransferase [Halodesulfovibrio sp.]MCT4534978.1 methyltransferase domain-containing protein [Halodesulfovibrio sp.]